jgi:hypothetical protein
MTNPCRVSTMRVRPRGVVHSEIVRTASASMAVSRSMPVRMRPSALLTILLVTTTMSPSRSASPGGACASAVARTSTRSSPGRTSGMPGRPNAS